MLTRLTSNFKPQNYIPMSKQNAVTIKVTESEKQQFNQTLVRTIKTMSQLSEGGDLNSYPLITGLCELLQKINT